MLIRVLALAALAACATDESVDDETDPFWDETRDEEATGDGDDGITPLGATAKRVALDPGRTTDAEVISTIPVGRSESGAERRVAMQLGPNALPPLARDDRLIVPAELEVTTRCDIGQNAPGCGYNPNVRAQLILTGNAGDVNGGGTGSKVIATQTLSCTKADHHCMFVFRPADATLRLDGAGTPPCVDSDSCYLNLVLWAWHSDARSGGQDKLLVGANEGNYLLNGDVESDKGRLMVVRERGITADDRAARRSGGSGTVTINTNANPELIYSHALKGGADLVAGEHFLIEAKLITRVSSRARFSTEMFLTKDRSARDDNGLERTAPAQIGEHNGFNCTAGSSPCTTRKVAVFRVQEEIQGPVYVNLSARSEVPGGGSARVTVDRSDGWVRSLRWPAAFGR